MNAAQNTQLTAAIERASKAGLRILGTGQRKSDGARLIVVTSSRSQVRAWPVAIVGGHLECPCEAGRLGRICSHRGLVYAHLLAEANAARSAAAAAPTDADATPPTSPARRGPLMDSMPAERRAFSIFKR